MPEIPVMSDIGDLFANIANNFHRLRYIISLLFGILLATYIASKILRVIKGGE